LAGAGAAGLAAAVSCLTAPDVARATEDTQWDRAKELGAVSVRDRSRTEFEPDGIRVGNYVLLPELGFRTSFKQDSAGRRNRDWKYDLTAALEARSMLPRHLLDLKLEGRATAHSESDSLGYLDGKAEVIGRYDIDHATSLFGQASSELVHDDNIDEELPAGLARRPAVSIQRAMAGLKRSAGRIDTAVGARYTRFEFGNAETNDGQIIDQSYRNTSTTEGFASVGYRFSPGYRVFAEASAFRIENQGDRFIDRDATGAQGSAGVEFELSPLVKVMLKGGYTHQDFRQSSLKDINAATYEARLDWYVSPLVSLTFNTRRDAYATSFADASARIVTSYSAKADYEIWRNLLLTGEATFRHVDFVGDPRTDRIWIGRIGLDYMASKHWLFTVGYEHQELESSDRAYDRKFDRVMVGAKYRF
jgi:hypothetical protein